MTGRRAPCTSATTSAPSGIGSSSSRAGAEIWQLIADYQVITDREMLGDIRGSVRSLTLDNIAAGLDPERATIFAHSRRAGPQPADAAVPEPGQRGRAAAQPHRQGRGERPPASPASAGCCSPTRSTRRPTSSSARPTSCRSVATSCRTWSRPASWRAASTSGTAPRFPEPDALLSEATLILGLDGTKMSKSKGNVIELRMTADETAKKLKGAKTDSDRVITYDPVAPTGGRQPAAARSRCARAVVPSRSPTRSATVAAVR